MSNHEELIAKAADAIQQRAAWPSLHWPNLDALQHRDVAEAIARAALQAVTVPTENEREALQDELDRHKYDGDNMCTCGDSCGGTTDGVTWTIETNGHLADAILAAGFRLPVPVEPNPFAESGHVAAKHWAELVRARNRIAELEAAPVEPETKRARAIQANVIAHLVIDQAKAALPDFFVPLNFRYGIADALWAAGYRKVAPVSQEKGQSA